MSVTSANPVPGKTANISLDDHRFTVPWLVVCTSRSDTEWTIIRSGKLPLRGTRHTDDTAAFVDTYSFRQNEDNPLLWDVDVNYTSKVDPLENENQPYDPPAVKPETPDVRWSSRSEQEFVLFDLDGRPIVNSAGLPFDPPSAYNVVIPILEITRNEPLKDGAFVLDWTDTINADPFRGEAPGELLLEEIAALNQFESDLQYSRVTYRFAYKRTVDLNLVEFGLTTCSRWDTLRLDEGLVERVQLITNAEVRTIVRPINDGNGKPVTQPHPLNGRGRKLMLDDNGEVMGSSVTLENGVEVTGRPFDPLIDSPTTLKWHRFVLRRRKTFAALNLGGN